MKAVLAAMTLFGSCTHGGPPPPLLTAETLGNATGSAWQATGQSDVTICGRAFPPRAGQVAARRVAFVDDGSSLVQHEVVTYTDANVARDAVAVLSRLPVTCPRYERRDPDGVTRVSVRTLSVAGTEAAAELLATFVDGHGQGWVMTATRDGASVSFLDVEAIDEGIPTAEYVATIARLSSG